MYNNNWKKTFKVTLRLSFSDNVISNRTIFELNVTKKVELMMKRVFFRGSRRSEVVPCVLLTFCLKKKKSDIIQKLLFEGVSPPGRTWPETRVGNLFHGSGRTMSVGTVLPCNTCTEGWNRQAGEEAHQLNHHVHRWWCQWRKYDQE